MPCFKIGSKKIENKPSQNDTLTNNDVSDNVKSNDNATVTERKKEKKLNDKAKLNNSLPDENVPEVILPPEPELNPPVHGIIGGVSFWGFSQRGESHIASNVPCQDRCVIDVINSSPLIVTAIADGVGSCMLSHYGAARATQAAVDYLKEKLVNSCQDLDDAFVGDLLRSAMNCAYEAVQKQAEELEQLEYSFQSTLTLAIYDGSTLFFSHAGDDGIVAILEDGTMDLATVRLKGEEISSVIPLQGRVWETRKTPNVNAFIMATDGVLDAFVRDEKEENKIYYPFIEPAVKPGQLTETDVKEVADFYYKYLESTEYRAKVTDDLTMVVVVNQKKIKEGNLPKFDRRAWERYSAKREAQIKAALYPAIEPLKIKEHKNLYMSSQNETLGQKKGKINNGSDNEYCRYCGKIIKSKAAKFCSECGNQLNKDTNKKKLSCGNFTHDNTYNTRRSDNSNVSNISRGFREERLNESSSKNKLKNNDIHYSRINYKTNDHEYVSDENRWIDLLLKLLIGAIIIVGLLALFIILYYTASFMNR